MANRYFSALPANEVHPSAKDHEAVSRCAETIGNAVIGHGKVPRMIDFWLPPISESRRASILILIAVGKTGDVQIVSEPRKTMALVSAIVRALVIEMLKADDAAPIGNPTVSTETLLHKKTA